MKLLMTFVFSMFLSITVNATAQFPDKIFYQGKEYSLHSNPLEAYFIKFPDKRPKTEITSTALWRGYIATFEIRDSILYLKDIEIQVRIKDSTKRFATAWKSVIKEVFPNIQNIEIDWLTGLLILPFGELVNYVHMGYASTYSNYMLLEIDKGQFKKGVDYTNKEYEEFKEKQFQAFKKTDEYRTMFDKFKKDNYPDKFIESFIKDFIIDYTSKLLVD